MGCSYNRWAASIVCVPIINVKLRLHERRGLSRRGRLSDNLVETFDDIQGPIDPEDGVSSHQDHRNNLSRPFLYLSVPGRVLCDGGREILLHHQARVTVGSMSDRGFLMDDYHDEMFGLPGWRRRVLKLGSYRLSGLRQWLVHERPFSSYAVESSASWNSYEASSKLAESYTACVKGRNELFICLLWRAVAGC